MNFSRRKMLLGTLLGAGSVGLRSLATGLPKSWLLGEPEAMADVPSTPPQYLIFATSGSGDPVNVNCPGSYVAGVTNNPNPELAPTSFSLGGKMTKAAKPWAQLPDDLKARLCFFHHRTYSNAHPEHPKVMALMGSGKLKTGNGSEMLASIIADETADRLQTIQREPIALGGEQVSFQGRPLQNVDPFSLQSLFAQPDNALENLHALRDKEIDLMYNELRTSGTSAQKKFLDRFALGRDQARKLGGQLADLLSNLPAPKDENASALSQVIAAVALIKMNVAPVVTIHLPFGGDNHNDAGLTTERDQTLNGIAAISTLWQQLKSFGLQDQVTFAMINVFGRNLQLNAQGGRNHFGNHHVTPMFGKHIAPGIIGGIAAGAAGAIDSKTGALSASGDIPPEQSLESVAKTLGAAVGVDSAVLESRIQNGKVVASAVRA